MTEISSYPSIGTRSFGVLGRREARHLGHRRPIMTTPAATAIHDTRATAACHVARMRRPFSSRSATASDSGSPSSTTTITTASSSTSETQTVTPSLCGSRTHRAIAATSSSPAARCSRLRIGESEVPW